MKTVLTWLLLAISLHAEDTSLAVKLAAAGEAPKGYPTPFLVKPGGCGMYLETLGKVYHVESVHNPIIKDCTVLPPGTVVWGHVHRILGVVVDLHDITGAKPRSIRYIVQNTTVVDPAKQ